MTGAAVFLDKDGTLVDNVPYNADPARVVLAPGAGAALALLYRRGFLLFVVSNQPGVGLGYFPVTALTPLSQRIQHLARAEGACLHGFYYCTHAPADDWQKACACRKPAPGLLFQAAAQHGVVLERSWFVGDILDDVEAGHRAGCRSVLIDNGNETEWLSSPLREPDYVARDVLEAARHIVESHARRRAYRGVREHAR